MFSIVSEALLAIGGVILVAPGTVYGVKADPLEMAAADTAPTATFVAGLPSLLRMTPERIPVAPGGGSRVSDSSLTDVAAGT